jgi:ABC-type branched-subunit amino acid transport system substrate-binding protein
MNRDPQRKREPRQVGRRRIGVVTVVLATALLAAACSSNSSSSTTTAAGGGGSGSNGGATAPGVTATSITIGATTPLTGPAAPGYDEIAAASNAVFKWANATGGVNGRQINYIVKDDAYNPVNTVNLTRQLVQQNNIFADVGSLGTPTQAAVEGFLNSNKVPQLFVESGCNCWSQSSSPWTFGWQPNYTVEGKILGQYIKQKFGGEKIGYLYQADEFGQDFIKGLNAELPASSVVSQQNYDAATLAGPMSNQIAALKAAGAQVVALATVPAATALALLPAASIGYSPQWVTSNVGADPPTVAALLNSFSKGAAGASLLNGMISDAYAPPEADTTNAWIQAIQKVLTKYDPGAPLDGNTEYGVALGYTFIQALQKAGPNLTRAGIVSAIETSGSKFVTAGLVPLTYSNSSHFGYSGAQLVTINNGASTVMGPVYTTTISGPITTFTGSPQPPPASMLNIS